MRDDKLKLIKTLLVLAVLILTTACDEKNHMLPSNKSIFDFDDFENSEEFYSILDVTEEYVYYYINFTKSDVVNDEGEFLEKNENVTIYKRDIKGNDSVVKENIGDIDIASFLLIENDVYLVTFEETDNQFLPVKYKVTKNYNEILLEGTLDSTLVIPSLHSFENKVYSLIENITHQENKYIVTKNLYEFTNNKLVYEIDENIIQDLSEINTLSNWSYGPKIVRSENNILFSLSKINKETDYIDSVINVYDGNKKKEINLENTYITNVFGYNDKIFFLEEKVEEKESFSSILSVTTLNDNAVINLNLVVQSITILNEKDNILTLEYTGVNRQQGFVTLDTETLEIDIIDDELFEENSIFLQSPSGVYRTNAVYVEGRGTYYDIVEKIY